MIGIEVTASYGRTWNLAINYFYSSSLIVFNINEKKDDNLIDYKSAENIN